MLDAIAYGVQSASAGDTAFAFDAAAHALTLSAFLVSTQNALLYGSTVLGTSAGLKSSSPTLTLFSTNGCVDNGGHYYTLSECAVSPARKGLTPAFLDFTEAAIRLCTSIRTALLLSVNANATGVIAADAATVERAAGAYLLVGFSEAASIWSTSTHTAISSFSESLFLACALSTLSLFAIMSCIFSPTIVMLDRNIKTGAWCDGGGDNDACCNSPPPPPVRSLLLLYPEAILESVPDIMDTVLRGGARTKT